jgi:antibiotic biosynthesis monooxygenase (ABM) superfamily enzyme
MMQLQIYFDVAVERAQDFERMYRETYVPALRKQQGYIRSTLLRLFPPAISAEIEAAATEFNYQIELVFDTEANRRRWVASPEHQAAWPLASGMARSVAWRGFDVAGDDAR